MADLSTLKKDQLVALAEAHGVESTGNKGDIVKALTDAGVETPEVEVPVVESETSGEEKYVRVASPSGHETTVPNSIVEALLDSGYTQI